MFYLIFNNKNLYEDLGVSIVKRPDISSPTKNINKVTVTGSDGDLYQDLGGYSDITITVNCNYVDKQNIKKSWRKIKSWINNIEDNKLIFSDDLEFYYKVKNVTLSALTVTQKILGTFTITFICEAYQYDLQGSNFIELSNNATLYNYLDESKPILKIHGSGVATITINDKSFTVEVGDYVYVNSALELTYKTTDNPANLLTGDYPILTNGENKISWDSNITKIEIQTNWRCL